MDPRALGLSDEDLKALGYDVQDRTSGAGDAGPAGPTATGRASSGARGWAWTVVLLLAMVWAAGLERRLPDPVPANRPDTGFSSARAMSQLVEIARRPRPPGSPEHRRVRTYLLDRLRSLGFEPEVQTVTSAAPVDGLARVATLRNVLVRIPGTDPTGAVAVTAHYDSRPLSPGAGDGGVGVAAVLETVRAVSSGTPLRNDLVVILADGHGVGVPGTRAFVDRHPWARDVKRVISVEMLGVSGPAIILEEEVGNSEIVRTVASATPRPVALSLARELPLDGPARSPALTPFLERGIPGIALTALGERETHGRATDRAIRVSESTLQHHGVQLLGLVRAYGARDLGTAGRRGDEAYFSLPAVGVIHHTLDWTRLLSATLIVGWLILVGALLWLGNTSRLGPLAGVAVAAVSLGAAVGAGWALERFLPGLLAEDAPVESALWEAGGHMPVLVALAVALVTACFALARRWFSTTELFLGTMAIPLGVAAWLAFRAPFAAPALQWSVALGLLSAALGLAVGPRRQTARWVSATLLLLSGGVLIVLVPHLELVAGVLTFREAPLLGGLTALVLLLVLPPLEWLRRPRSWWTPGAAVGVAVALLVLDVLSFGDPARHPVPSALLYLVDDTLAASPLPEPQSDPDAAPMAGTDPGLPAEPDTPSAAGPEATRRVTGRWLLIPGRGEDWARSWVVEEETGSTEPGVLLLSRTGRYQVAGWGPDAEVAPPRIRILADEEREGRRHLRLALRSGLGGEMVGVHLPAGGTWAEVAGVDVGGAPAPEPVRSVLHWGEIEDGWLTLDVRPDPGQQRLEVLVVEHHLRPEEVLGEGFFRRDGRLIPDADAESDRVIQRTRAVLTLPAPSDER